MSEQELAWPESLARKDKIIERLERDNVELKQKRDELRIKYDELQERHNNLLSALEGIEVFLRAVPTWRVLRIRTALAKVRELS